MATDTQNRPPLVSVEVVETVARGVLSELEAAEKALERATDAARELERIADRADYQRFAHAISQEIEGLREYLDGSSGSEFEIENARRDVLDLLDLIALAKRPAAYDDGGEEDDAG